MPTPNVGFDALCALLRYLGFEEPTRSSHHMFRRVGVEELINLPAGRRQGEGLPGTAGSGDPDEVRADDGGAAGGRMSTYEYELIVYWSGEDAAFVVDVPELPGCMAHGATPTEAVEQAQEAIALWLEVAREDGRPIRQPEGRRLLLA